MSDPIGRAEWRRHPRPGEFKPLPVTASTPQPERDTEARCECGHLARHHVAGMYRCPVVVDFSPTVTCRCREFHPSAPSEPPTAAQEGGWRSRWITVGNGTDYGSAVATREQADADVTPPTEGAKRAGVQFWLEGVGWITDKTEPSTPPADAPTAAQEPAPVPHDEHERQVLALIDERDRLEEIADRLAAVIAPADVLGEHSSDNRPWQNALDYADQRPTPPADAPEQQDDEQQRAEVARWLATSIATYAEAFASGYDDRQPNIDWQEVATDFVESCEIVDELLRLLGRPAVAERDDELHPGRVTREDRAVAVGMVRKARAANSDDEVDAARDAIAQDIADERALVTRRPTEADQ